MSGGDKSKETFYEILGLHEKCSDDEIKKAYRKLSFMHHPDKNNNSQESTEKFQKICQAYEILGNPEKRREYDITKNNPFLNGGIHINPMDIFNMFMGGVGGNNNQQGFPPGFPPGFPFGIPGFGGININPTPVNIGNINQSHGGIPGMFTNIFPGGAFNVGENISFEMRDNGNGGPHVFIRTFTNPPPQQPQRPPMININLKITLEQSCQGSKVPLEYEKWIINNEKQHTTQRIVENINVPVGIDDGEVIILNGKGNQNEYGLVGDVKITINIEPHNIFKRNGLDLLIEKKISLKESLCGFTFEVTHLKGKTFQFNNANGHIIKDGLIKTIPKLGIEKNNDCGNLIVKFIIDYPELLTPEQVKVLNEIL